MKTFARTAALVAVIGLGAASTASAQTGGAGASTEPSTTTTQTSTTTQPSTASSDGVSQTTTVKLTRSQTKSVQRRVHVRADGSLGARTRSALKRYQSRAELTRTGRPNLETLRAMKLKMADRIEAKMRAADASSASTAPAPTGSAAAAVNAARAQIGVPYVSGGNDPSGFDCSGLTVYVFKQAGISLPRTSFEQYEQGTPVDRSAIQAGDLVFFDTAGDGASHVGIATSPTTVISATTHGVMEHQLDDDYWGAHYVGARRVAA